MARSGLRKLRPGLPTERTAPLPNEVRSPVENDDLWVCCLCGKPDGLVETCYVNPNEPGRFLDPLKDDDTWCSHCGKTTSMTVIDDYLDSLKYTRVTVDLSVLRDEPGAEGDEVARLLRDMLELAQRYGVFIDAAVGELTPGVPSLDVLINGSTVARFVGLVEVTD
jgi:hypothetical protein